MKYDELKYIDELKKGDILQLSKYKKILIYCIDLYKTCLFH